MNRNDRLPLVAVLDLSLRAAIRFLPLFLLLALAAFVIVMRISAQLDAGFPPPDQNSYEPDLTMRWRDLTRWALEYSIVLLQFLTAGLIIHRAFAWTVRATVSFRADIEAVRKAFPALAIFALLWHALLSLPFWRDWLYAVTIPATWFAEADWLPTTVAAYLSYFTEVFPVLSLGGAIVLLAVSHLCLALPVAVVERHSPLHAARRSLALTKGCHLRILALLAILYLSGWAIKVLYAWIYVLTLDSHGLSTLSNEWGLTLYDVIVAMRWTFGLILSSAGIAMIYAHSRGVREATSQIGAIEPVPTIQS